MFHLLIINGGHIHFKEMVIYLASAEPVQNMLFSTD